MHLSLQLLARAGFGARGVVYVLLGYFALTTAGGEATRDVLERLGDAPAGGLLLLVVAAGLFAYGAFRLHEAWQDGEDDGRALKGIAKRGGRAASGLAHLGLCLAAASLALGGGGGEGSEQAAAEYAFDIPGGALAVGIAGALVVIAGLGNFLEAWAASFERLLDPRAPDWTHWAGRIGYAARGIVFVAIGWQVIALAAGLDDGRLGMAAATADLARREWLFALIAAGLGAFGLFSLVMARHARIRDEIVLGTR